MWLKSKIISICKNRKIIKTLQIILLFIFLIVFVCALNIFGIINWALKIEISILYKNISEHCFHSQKKKVKPLGKTV